MIAEEEPRAQKDSNKQQNHSILFLQISCCNIPTNLTQGCDLISNFISDELGNGAHRRLCREVTAKCQRNVSKKECQQK